MLGGNRVKGGSVELPALRYNFVFFFVRCDFWFAYFGEDLINCKNVRMYPDAIDGIGFVQKLFRYHWAYSINRKIHLPLKSLWFNRMYEQDFDEDLPLCFVYLGGNSIYHDGGWLKYVKRRNPKNKNVVLHLDLISKKITDFSYESLKLRADLCITYDRSEARKYGIHLFDKNTYTRIVNLPEIPDYKWDVYFLGAAKDRLDEIVAAYDLFESKGLKCKFVIVYAAPDQRVKRDGIEFLEREITYRENIENVIASKSILEITQKGAVGMTLRAREALAYQRRLVSNVPDIDESLYNDGQLVRFTDAGSIDVNKVAAPYEQGDFEQKYPPDPLERLYDIQEQLDGYR